MVLFIISAVIVLCALGVGLYLAINFIRNIVPPVPFIPLLKRLAIIMGVFTLSFASMMISIYLWGNIHPTAYELVAAIIGGLCTGSFGFTCLFSFLIHYYGKGETKGISVDADKWLFRAMIISFPLLLASILFLTEGYAAHVTYPLVNGLNFSKGFVNPESGHGTNIAFYALCILSGAIYVYFICDHKFYQQYGKHGILESTFLVAFPAGIIGARLFYVIGNWNVEFATAENPFLEAINITKGGLTILGGAITGIVIGVGWFLWRNKGYSIWIAVDIIVPTILIAQAVGRWGNFFNCEVHGVLSPISSWQWLPRFIYENARYSSTNGWAPDGQLWVPLFLVECMTNLAGYFVIAYLFGKLLRKHTALGDLALGYVVWYGLTRVLMEPLRDTSFNMGKDGYWSWIWSLVFVIGGALLIALNHLIRYLLKPRNVNQKQYIIGSIATGVSALALLIPGIILMATSKFEQNLVLNQFNWGLIILSLGISILFGLVITIPPLFIKKKEKTVADA